MLDNVRSAFNVGSIFRTADAGAVEHIYLCGQVTCWPPHPKLEKTSLGAHEYVPWSRFPETETALEQLRQTGIPIIGLETVETAYDMQSFRWPSPVALVFGHEVLGLSQEVQQACDQLVRIPAFGVKNSLNVATAFGIVLYDVLSKR